MRPARSRALGPWFHNLHLPDGPQTARTTRSATFRRFKWRQIAAVLPADLTGWTALDIGCNAGFYSFELARRGAEVLGIDVDPHYLRQAAWAAASLDLGGPRALRAAARSTTCRTSRTASTSCSSWASSITSATPCSALDIVAEKVKRLLIFQTLTLPGDEVLETPPDLPSRTAAGCSSPAGRSMAFVEGKFAGDPTNWWVPNHACSEALLRSAGLRVTARPGDEMFCCEPAPDRPAAPYRQALPALAVPR